MRKGLTSRLLDLEQAARRRAEEARVGWDETRWLAAWERLEREGFFAGEPDAGRALAEYRRALEPPRDAAEVERAWGWLATIAGRVEKGIPPVSEGEFSELAGWLAENSERLRRRSHPSGALALEGGREVAIADLLYWTCKGPRTASAGRVAEAVRQLRQLHPG